MSSSPTSSSSNEAARASSPSFGDMADLVCPVDIMMGHGNITIGACLRLANQSVIRLAQSAGADPDIVVNGVPVARGQVVIVEDATAIRITEILAAPGLP